MEPVIAVSRIPGTAELEIGRTSRGYVVARWWDRNVNLLQSLYLPEGTIAAEVNSMSDGTMSVCIGLS